MLLPMRSQALLSDPDPRDGARVRASGLLAADGKQGGDLSRIEAARDRVRLFLRVLFSRRGLRFGRRPAGRTRRAATLRERRVCASEPGCIRNE